ncbi:MAG: sensor histidine kinase [Gammaproteobacteria bacterium]|nr:sensor histidine kinase [Gammaproteobacteria bacterium]
MMPGHVYWKNKNGIYLGCNEAQASYVKKHYHNEFIGKTTHDLLPKAIADQIVADDNYVMSTGNELTIEEITPEGGTVLSKKIPLKDQSGEIVGMLGISFDVSERSRREKELKIIQDHTLLTLDNIVANLPGHVYWLDKEGLVYLGCNNNQARAIGLKSREEVVGKSLYNLYEKSEAERILELNQKILKAGEPVTIVEEGPGVSDGSAVFLTQKVPMKDKAGNIVGLLGISLDITVEKEAEKLRKEKLVIEESLKNAKLMAAGIAHELRTPLATINSIAGNLEHFMPDVFKGYEIAMDENKVEQVNDEVLDYLKTAPKLLKKVTYASNTFIDMMLMKVSLDNVKREELSRLSMSACVEESVKLYPLEEADRKLLKLNLNNNFDFMGDKTLFTHIIFNLLKNALYYIKAAQKGEISIWFELGAEFNTLHFKDTGKGMSPEVSSNLFGAFYSKTRHGAGVGLALCRLIMQEFGGSISCDSVAEEFTHFKMLFPALRK